MSNVESTSQLMQCQTEAPKAQVEILAPRDVPLGGLRAMPVRRTLPQRQRSLIGAWCFCDHYGPEDVAVSGGMHVAPHPHTGLQTVSWLFSGEVEHRDSVGSHAMVRPGELNLMTAGRGIAHSEVSTPSTTVLHGLQLWVALPESARFTEPTFEHYVPQPVSIPGGTMLTFLGGDSPVRTFTPLLGAEIRIDDAVELPLDPSFEHGVLVDAGPVSVNGTDAAPSELAYLPVGTEAVHLRGPGRVALLGGAPLGEQILMWWNFVGRTDAEVREYRAQWQSEFERTATATQFGVVPGYTGAWIPAPEVPTTALRPRG